MKEYHKPLVTVGLAAAQLAYDQLRQKKQEDSDEVHYWWPDPMDLAGNAAVRQRSTHKRKLRSGRVGRKLQRINDEYVYRWHRIYNYGQNNIAYPSGQTQASNLIGAAAGRLQLSHYTTGSSNMLPVYLWDLTCWRTIQGDPDVCKRLSFDNLGRPTWNNVNSQQQTHAVIENSWQPEKSDKSLENFPDANQQAALLKWVDMRMCFYGARKHPTRIVLELIQFKDEKYNMDFHEDGEAFVGLSSGDQNDVKSFWIEETKKLMYHPLDVQQFERSRAITSLYRDSFQISPDDSTNMDVCPPNVVKKLFKRFNRLVKWNWQQPTPTVDPDVGDLELPTFNTEVANQILPYAHPHARIYLYIRAEDVDSVTGDSPIYTAPVAPPILNNDVVYGIYSANDYTIPPDNSGIINQVNNLASPAGTYVCGYDWKIDYENTSSVRNYQAWLMPRYCQNEGTEAYWSTTDTPSFDIIIRQKWVLQN